ncbi:MAG: putative porin [Bacteroidaceae bacterium]|nr:putative porin [Bacteroidaceae bacterium]
MRIRLLLLLAVLALTMGWAEACAQTFKVDPDSQDSGGMASSSRSMGNTHSSGRNGSWGRDTTETQHEVEIPIGVTQWTVDELLGDIIPAENNDTVVHAFQEFNETSGYNGEYNILGNLGAPRLSRIYLNRGQHVHQFLEPHSFLIRGLQDFRFSNTLSPMTNLAYHKVGNRTNGQERVHAYFASNINKQAGIGMKFDYLYGRGYYNNQANSQFGGTLFGYYLGDRYNMHAFFNYNHLKMAENGGIEDDAYIHDPQSIPQRYSSKDIPTLLSETWNRNQNEDAFLTHRYNLGFYRDIELPDSLKPKEPTREELLEQLTDSVLQLLKTDSVRMQLVVDSLHQGWLALHPAPKQFVPVSSIIHTLRINNLRHTYYAHETPSEYYSRHYYGSLSDVKDRTQALSVRNIVGLSLREGFNRWAQMGIAAFLSHELLSYTLPRMEADTLSGTQRYNEHDLAVGGQISRQQGDWLHYNVVGQFSFAGHNVGNFNVDGQVDLKVPLSRRDTLDVELHALVSSLGPNFYFRHYHSQFCWWDNESLSNEFKTRIEGTLRLPRTGTSLRIGLENVKNYTYYAMQNTLLSSVSKSPLPSDYSHAVSVVQHSGNIQVFSATLQQNVKLGPLHWDNDVTYQTTSSASALPLPRVSLYSNLYLQFRIARVLNVELGGDLRYFTRYFAPDYSPAVQQFAVQDGANPCVAIGNYPIVGVYANLHIKRCRLYVAMQHVNEGTGNMFWAPHYPMDPRTFHFGLSWNFFN